MQDHLIPFPQDEQMKTCIRCGKSLPLRSFFLRSKSGSKRRGHCKACHLAGASPQSRWVVLTISLRKHGKSPGARALREALGEPSECYLCGGAISWETASLDHVTPRSRGGTNELSNLRWAHRRCNRYKSDMTIDELVEYAQRIISMSQRWDIPSTTESSAGGVR